MSAPRAAFSLPLYASFQAFILLGYALKPSWYRPLLFIPIAVIGIYLLFFTTTGTKADAGLGNTIATQLAHALDGIVVRDVQSVLHRIGEKPGQITSAGYLSRFAWASQLHLNPRGIGWNHEILHLHQDPSTSKSSQSRRTFFLSRLYNLSICTAVQVVFSFINAANPALAPGAKALVHQSLYIRGLSALGFGATALVTMNAQHCAISIVAVALGISQPADWPPLYGPLKTAYTVANFWRHVWHQILRNPLTSIASFITHSIFRIPHLTPNSSPKTQVLVRLLRLHLVFLLSAFIHLAGGFMVTGYATSGPFTFFILQPWAITLEVGIQYLFTRYILQKSKNNKKSPRPIWRIVSYIWTVSWFFTVLPLLQQQMVDGGMFLGIPGSDLTQNVSRWLALDTV